MIKALVIDDERYAREELVDLLEETGQVEVIGECSNAIEGLKKINSLKPDVIFLDIQMPQITGIELLSMLDPET
ncbi:response regulator, partial [Vibrio natriegens]